MTTVKARTAKQLLDQRAKLLKGIRLSEEELRERAERHELSAEEYYVLESLEEIDYLLGSDSPAA
jgi:hypothetical protein